jgi:hypothetical protein
MNNNKVKKKIQVFSLERVFFYLFESFLYKIERERRMRGKELKA